MIANNATRYGARNRNGRCREQSPPSKLVDSDGNGFAGEAVSRPSGGDTISCDTVSYPAGLAHDSPAG